MYLISPRRIPTFIFRYQHLQSTHTLSKQVPKMTISTDSNHKSVSGLTTPLAKDLSALSVANFAAAVQGHAPTGTIPDSALPAGAQKPILFTPLIMPYTKPDGADKLILKNRVIVSPMCQYSAKDGMPSPYHIAHLGSFALHGVGSIVVEASGVVPEGRISPQCLGIWSEAHRDAHKALVSSLKSFSDSVAMGIQLAHAGRKASEWSPFHLGQHQHKNWVTEEEGGWPEQVVGPSAIPYSEAHLTPKELDLAGIQRVHDAFVQAARWSFEAGYDFVELHSAHGYLFHSFLSPLSNHRNDQYGGSFENRSRLLVDVVKAICKEFPNKGLWVRISSTDFAEEAGKGDSWTVQASIQLAKVLDQLGVDLIDVSGGGLAPFQKIKPGPGYQLFAARAIRKALQESAPSSTRMLVGAVGMMEGAADSKDLHHLSNPGQLAEQSLEAGDCDAVLLARGMMANPKWTEDAAFSLTHSVRSSVNPQYHRTHAPRIPKV